MSGSGSSSKTAKSVADFLNKVAANAHAHRATVKCDERYRAVIFA